MIKHIHNLLYLLISSLLLITPASADDRGELFDAVASALEKAYFDESFRVNELPPLIKKYRPLAEASTDFKNERLLVHQFLSEIPASHLGLLSEAEYKRMFDALFNRTTLTCGLELIELDGGHYVHALLAGSPADISGIKMGDRVVFLDGESPEVSGYLDWRSDDAYLPDPPIHNLMCNDTAPITFKIERIPGEFMDISVTPKQYSAFDAINASAEIINTETATIAYIHFWYIHMQGLDTLLQTKLKEDFKECDALIIDLRGRGGNAFMVQRILNVLKGENSVWDKPVVAIIDDLTRSAKEALAWDLKRNNVARLIGTTTAGALLPATFRPVGQEMILMFPAFKLKEYSDAIEGTGVKPHIHIKPNRMYTNGNDALIEGAIKEAARLATEKAAKSDQTHAGDFLSVSRRLTTETPFVTSTLVDYSCDYYSNNHSIELSTANNN